MGAPGHSWDDKWKLTWRERTHVGAFRNAVCERLFDSHQDAIEYARTLAVSADRIPDGGMRLVGGESLVVVTEIVLVPHLRF